MDIKRLVSALALSLSSLIAAAEEGGHAIKMPQQEMGFLENVGQVKDQYFKQRDDVQFSLRSNGLNIFIGKGALHYQFSKNNNQQVLKTPGAEIKNTVTETYRLDLELVNANRNAAVTMEDKQPGYNIYHLPGLNDAVANIYKKVTYKNIYPNIDWVLYIKNGTLEYEFEVRAGGKPSDIKLRYTGANSIALNNDGSVNISSPMGTIKEHTPHTYALNGAEIKSGFKLEGSELSFDIAQYKGAVTIDPVLTWGTYYGGSADDNSQSVNIDGSGNVYMCGYSISTANIATVGSQQATLAGGYDGFIAKFSSAGVLLWATYYGGADDDYLYSTSCDGLGNVYAGGRTYSSSGIATLSAHQTTMLGLSDAFLLKLDENGQLQWCTYYGGYSNEFGNAVACDGNNNVYLCGATSSGNNIATPGTHQAFQFGGYQAFLVKFNSSGTRQWGTYFGGTSDDYGNGMCIDGANYVYICGRATSTDYIASASAFQTAHAGGANDGFLAKFNSADGNTSWSTYYGDAGDDQAYGLACMGSTVYLCGQTDGTATIATALSHQSSYGGGTYDGFLVQFDSTGARQWATYYGGGNDDYAKDLSCDASTVYVTGYTNSSDNIASATTYQATPGGGQDVFLVKFSNAGVRDWGTYYGGSGDDFGASVTNNLDNIYVCGYTGSSTAMATNNAHQASLSSDPDGFLAKFGDCVVAPAQPGSITGSNSVCERSNQNYFILPVPGATSYTWTLPSGWTGTSTASSILATVGNTGGNITVTANNGCGSSPSQSFSVTVNPIPTATITAAGPLSFCQGDSVVLNGSTGNGISYKWQRNSVDIPGATNPSYTALISGSYRIIETSTCGNDTSTATMVTVNPLPAATVTLTNNQLSTGTFTNYQWYLNGAPVNGATNQNYTATQNGDYYVRVIDGNGCASNSDTVSVTGLYIRNVMGANGTLNVNISPNPNSGVFTLRGKGALNEGLFITISDVTGRTIMSKEFKIENGNINETIKLESNISPGLYIVKLTAGINNTILRFIKQ